ncbi:MAG: DUF1186 domain-containing protein, partial [Ignavibacteriales bacterium]|nr:DUF1186 domain-containing protein [Ignavibacteriales bacterium]
RETVILDLENVLKDAIHRYYYFQKFEYAEEVCSFPLHAMLLLAELQSEKSLPLIVDFLSYEKEFIDFWLCDHITETLWLPIYKLGNNNLEILERFLLQPGIDTYGKLAVSMALQQMVLHQPEKRNVIADLYERVFSYFNKASFEDNLIDSDFLGLAIGDTIDCGITELLPVIKSLHEKGYVSEGINGTYEDVVKLFKRPLAEYKYKEILSIQNLYTHILSTWWGYKEENIAKTEFEDIEDAIFEDAEEEGTLWKREKKHTVGRNEPCPCGSGKKYKKCCIDKH